MLASLLYVAVVLAQAGGDPRDFIRYDGHYTYQIALRNFESPAAVAAVPAKYEFRENAPPAYRYQRILYPMVARWLGLGRPDWILWTLRDGSGPGCPDQGIRADFPGGAGGLSRAEAPVAAGSNSGDGALPYLAYQAVLWVWLGTSGLGSGEPFILLPLGGWLMAAETNMAAFLLISIPIVPAAILPTFAGLALSIRSLLAGLNHPFVLSLLFSSVFTFFLPHLTFREASAMVRVTQGLAISFLLVGALTKSGRILNYGFLWIFTNVLLVKGAV